ncbi:MAG: 4-hydroxythreonine-4-phosphate dehydrogenase PdxA [Planctomycetia bacterium]|nr:4-hydroxythreonine-4-phosphate dehydrogenase PdxA [Planctomycetia bacterium]
MNRTNPILGLTMGDPAGVGPEIIAAAWPGFFDGTEAIPSCRPVVYGHPDLIRRALALRKINATVTPIETLDAVQADYFRQFGPNNIPCLTACRDEACAVPDGQIDPRAGQAAYDCLVRAIDAAKSGVLDAIVTAPLNKKSLNLAGHNYPGHTEILADRCGVEDYAMMLYLGPGDYLVSPTGLAVVHVTLHTAMRNVFDQITQASVLAKCHLIRDFMWKIKGSEPRIGVCSLNCHNGEEGLFGREELDIIRPAIDQAVRDGLDAHGTFPPDTLMLAARNGEFDGIVAMIHDQGHIAVKLMGMHRAVNITLGLPIIRTSVAHGTAFDRAWQGTAKITSLYEAVRVAVLLARK